MTSTLKTVILALAVGLASPTAGAQSALTVSGRQLTPAPSLSGASERYVDMQNGLSLAEAVAQAIDREPMLRAARSDVEAARGMRLQAGLRPNPSVSLERREEAGGADNQTMVQVEWPLDLFRLAPRTALANREVEAAERSVDERIRRLVGDVRRHYGQAAAAIREVAVAESLASSLRASLDVLRQRVNEGAAPPLDRDRMEVEYQQIEAEQLMAEGRADAAMIELRRAIGAPADTPLLLRDTLEVLAPPPVTSGTQTPGPPAADPERLRHRTDVREAEARVSVADSRIDRARSEGRFDVSLFGSYSRMNQGFPQLGTNARGNVEPIRGVFHYVSAGAMVSVPFRNRNQGEIAVAQAERTSAVARLESTRLDAQAELAAGAARDVQARRALNLAAGSVRLARQNLEVVRQTFELGRGTVSDVLMEQRRYWDVERTYTETLHAAYDAQVALQQARGERP